MNGAIRTVQGIYEAVGRGDIAAILSVLAEDVQWEHWEDNSAVKAGVPWLQARQGRDGAAAFFGVLATQLQVRDLRVVSMMASDTQVAVAFVIEADVPATGRRLKDEEMHLWTFNAEGHVSRFRHYTDTAKHIHVAGLT